MAAIALEPAPRAVVSSGSAVRGAGIAAFLFAIRNAWRVATAGGRPFAVRAQALAFVLDRGPCGRLAGGRRRHRGRGPVRWE